MADMTRDEDKELRARAICKDDYDIDGVKWACEGGCIHPKAGSVCPYLSAAEATMKAEADAGRDYESLLARIAELEARCGELGVALNGVMKDAYQKIRDGTGEANELAHRIWDTADAALSGDGSRVADVLAAARDFRPGNTASELALMRTVDALDAGEGDDG